MLENKKHVVLVLALLLISFCTLMLGNGGLSLTHPDEVFYMQTVKEMMQRHEWLVPYIFDAPQFEKPIMTYWLMIVAVKVFGLTPFASRFIPALFGVIGVLGTYALAFWISGKRTAAFLSGVVLATSFIWVALSRAVLTDMVFSVWVLLSLVFFYDGYLHPKRKNLGIILSCVLAGTAVLTKGALGFIFPFGIIAMFLLYRKDIKFLGCWATLIGFVLFLAIAIPWHIYCYSQFGQGFIDEYWQNVHVRRIFQAEHQKSNTWYFYLMTIFAGVFPWSLFLVPLGSFARDLWRASKGWQAHLMFLLLWIVWVFGVVQLAQSKLASYVFPVFPAFAILLGIYFESVLAKKAEGNILTVRLYRGFSLAMGVGLFLAAVVGIYFVQKFGPAYDSLTAGYVFIGLLAVCAASLVFFILRKDFVKSFAAKACLIVALLVPLSLSFRAAEPWVSCKQICDIFKNIDTSNDIILTSKFYARGVRYYTDRPIAVIDINDKGFFSPHPIPFLNTDQKVLDFLNERPITYCIVKKNQWESLKRIIGDKFKIIFFEGIGGKYILSIEKISNT